MLSPGSPCVCSKAEAVELLLNKCANLFDGMLGKWQHKPVELELKEGTKPHHARPHFMPKCQADTLQMKVNCSVEMGAPKQENHSEWVAPSFVIPKKDGRVRFINDFWQLDKPIQRKPCPIPNTQKMLSNLEGFQHTTSLNLGMGCHHIKSPVSPTSEKLCTLWCSCLESFRCNDCPLVCAIAPTFSKKRCRCCLSDWNLSKPTLTTHLCQPNAVLKTIWRSWGGSHMG